MKLPETEQPCIYDSICPRPMPRLNKSSKSWNILKVKEARQACRDFEMGPHRRARPEVRSVRLVRSLKPKESVGKRP